MVTARRSSAAAPVKMEVPRPVRDRLGLLQDEISAAFDRAVSFGEVWEILLSYYDARELAPGACEGCGTRYRHLHRPGCTEGGPGAGR